MSTEYEKRISISSQVALKGENSLSSLWRLLTWDLQKVSEVSKNLGVGVSLEPLTRVTALGRDLDRIAINEIDHEDLDRVTMISQPPRSEKSLLDVVPEVRGKSLKEIWSGIKRMPVAFAYAVTQRYRENNLTQMHEIQKMVQARTGKMPVARMHEPLNQVNKRVDHHAVEQQQLTTSNEYFNHRILAEQGQNLTDTQKVQILARFIEENGYTGFSANLIHILSGEMSDNPIEFLKELLDKKISIHNMSVPLVNQIEVQPGRDDLEENVPFLKMLPYIADAAAARDDIHFMYAGTMEHAGHDIHEIKKLIRN